MSVTISPKEQSCVLSNTFKANDTPVSFKIYTKADHIPALQWEKQINAPSVFLAIPYLQAIEESLGTFVQFRYVIFYRNDAVVGVAYFQIFRVIDGLKLEEGEQLSWTEKLKNQIKKRINQKQLRVLVSGNPLLTGEHGFSFSSSLSEKWCYDALAKAIENIKNEFDHNAQSIDIILVKDFHPDNIENARELAQIGLKEVEADPSMFLRLPAEWQNFDDYLQALTSKYRVRAKKIIKKADMLTRKNLSAEEIIAHQEKIYALYKNVCDRAGFKLLSISPNYFFTLKKHLHNDFQLKAYFYQGELVAFISYFIEKKVTETHFIGFDEKDNNTWAIYQNILYDMVAEGIAQQTNTLALGRTALEVKSTIGATGVPMNNFIWSKNLVLHAASQKLFQWLNQHEWTPRNPFK